MKSLKIIFTALAALSFAFLTACGEGFQAAELGQQKSEAQDEQIKRTSEEAPASETAVVTDNQLIDNYQAQENNTGSNNNQAFAETIEAVTLIRRDNHSSQGSVTLMTMTMMLGCDSEVSLGNVVDMVSLNDGGRASLGTNGTFEFEVVCSNSSCSELIATVIRSNPNGVNAIAHFGLAGEQTQSSAYQIMFEYNSRQSDGDNFYEVDTVAQKREVCLEADASDEVSGEPSFNDPDLDAGFEQNDDSQQDNSDASDFFNWNTTGPF